MDVRTNDPHYTWKNKAESVINIIKGKFKRIRVQMNILKKVWDFGMFWEAEIYYHTTGKYGHPSLERLKYNTIEISEWMEFKFYNLVWFWKNLSDNTKTMLVQLLEVSHRV